MSVRVHTDVFVDVQLHMCPAVCIHVRIEALVVVFVF